MTAMKIPAPRTLITLLMGALMPTAAMAHPGHDGTGAGFMAGVLHPLSGLDHVLMIVAVSLWAAQQSAAGRMVIAACLGLFVAIGALAPVAPPAGPGLEAAIALTVIGAGVLLAAGRRWPVWATASLAALFALIHGFAHGAEAPATSATHVPGVVAATSGLALLVSFLAARLQTHRAWLRGAGIFGAITGAAALFNA
jgi:urease accessory protein